MVAPYEFLSNEGGGICCFVTCCILSSLTQCYVISTTISENISVKEFAFNERHEASINAHGLQIESS